MDYKIRSDYLDYLDKKGHCFIWGKRQEEQRTKRTKIPQDIMKNRNENRLDTEIIDKEKNKQEGSTAIVKLQEINHLLITLTQKLQMKPPQDLKIIY